MKNKMLNKLPKIAPKDVSRTESFVDFVDNCFQAYNGARLREACQLFAEKMAADDSLVGISLTGALTPAGLGISSLVPLIEAGFIDYIASTGANLYHDAHFPLGFDLYQGSPHLDDVVLRKDGVIRVYDVLFDQKVLFDTDAFYTQLIREPIFQKKMGCAEFHYELGRFVDAREKALGVKNISVLAACFRNEVPVYVPSIGDSTIGMNAALTSLEGYKIQFDPNLDVNETAAIVYHAKKNNMKSSVFVCGGGAPKNFLLQTEPYIQEILGLKEDGHDYFIQITDARPDTGGLSGATPAEAVSWGKINPDKLPGTVVVYTDTTIALPIIAHYVLSKKKNREKRRLYKKLGSFVEKMKNDYIKIKG